MNYPLGTKEDSRAPWNQQDDSEEVCEYCGAPMEREDDDYEKQVIYTCTECDNTIVI